MQGFKSAKPYHFVSIHPGLSTEPAQPAGQSSAGQAGSAISPFGTRLFLMRSSARAFAKRRSSEKIPVSYSLFEVSVSAAFGETEVFWISIAVVANLVKQGRARENPLTHLLAVCEKRADRAHGAPQFALRLTESCRSALAIKTEKQIASFHILGFLGKDLDHDTCRVGMDRDEISGDKSIVGHDPEAPVEPPIDGISRKAEGERDCDQREQEIAAAADCLAIKRHWCV
jgi:hypothetical protein